MSRNDAMGAKVAEHLDLSLPVAELLPHDGPMVLLDRLVSASDNDLLAEVAIRPGIPFAGDNGNVPAWLGIEYMAQAIGALTGLKKNAQSAPINTGYLVSCRDYRCTVPEFACGSLLLVQVTEKLVLDDRIGAFDCEIRAQTKIASARLSVYEQLPEKD